LKEQIEQEDLEKRSAADQALAAAKAKAAAGVKLTSDDLAEIDFTVEGKASSCGNCYLGDAFRYSFRLTLSIKDNDLTGKHQVLGMSICWIARVQARRAGTDWYDGRSVVILQGKESRCRGKMGPRCAFIMCATHAFVFVD